MLSKLFWLATWAAAACALCFGALSLSAYLMPDFWFTDNMSFFHRQLIGGGVAAWIVGLTGLLAPHQDARRIKAILVAGFALIACSSVLTVLRTAELTGTPPTQKAGMPLRIVSINLETLYLGTERLTSYLEGLDADLVVMQETAMAWQRHRWENRRGSEPIAGTPPFAKHTYSGRIGDVVVFSRYPITRAADIQPPYRGPQRRFHNREFLDLEIDIAGTPVRFFALHPSSPRTGRNWHNRQAYFAALSSRLADLDRSGNQPVIVLGDWNMSPWSGHFRDFLNEHQLTTAFPGGFPRTTRFFYDYRLRHVLGATVDHIAVSEGVSIKTYDIGPDIGSDHLPLVADIVLPAAANNPE